ncbi:TPA: hypothetical protein LLS86_000424 [Serratia liquefaciens]|nr:hypothetical protein [Serratia liquefaciens]
MITQGYTSDEQSVVKNVIGKYSNTGLFIIDPADPLLVRFYDIQLKLAGLTSGYSPQFTQCWQETKRLKRSGGRLSEASNGSSQPVYSIVRLDSTDGSNYRADAIGSLPVSAANVTQTLGLFDGEAVNVGAVNHNQSYVYAADCTLSANGVYPASQIATDYPVTVIYTFAQTIDRDTIYGAEIITTQSYPKDIYNESPRSIINPNEIKICLTRDEPDCDYRNTYDGSVRVPIKGNITYLGQIELSGGQPVKASNTIYLIRTRAGGDPVTPLGNYNIFNSPNTRINGNNISWDLDWLRFNQVNFDSGEWIYYVFKVILNVEGKSIVAFITNAPKEIEPDQRFLNTVQLKPMRIVYGCLAGDSKILMQDGSEKLISAIDIGETVLSKNNNPLRVEAVTRGQEHHYLEISVRNSAGNIRKITASLGHPFITPSGVVIARELTSSSKLITLDGESEIVSIVQQQGDLKVYNLQLSSDDEHYTDNCLYANGILVGDIQMQRVYEDEYHQRPANILSKLPKEWHQDYQNHLDKAGK